HLVYRGYTIEDLAENSTFEETTYLLLYGKLPTRGELDEFNQLLVSERGVPDEVIDVLRKLPRDVHPMLALETGTAALGAFDPETEDESIEAKTRVGVRLISKIATLAGAVARIRAGRAIVAPDPSLGHGANFLYMMTGEKPSELAGRIMDVALLLHADHGMNASTFTCMVVASTMSDMYSAVTAGIASLKGPLHGGANERSLKELQTIPDVEAAVKYVADARAQKKKIMGFGHRVYKAYDPRARILSEYARQLTEQAGAAKIYEVAKKVEEEVIAAYGEKGIFPNVDFYSGIVYNMLGIETRMFTPIFVVGRMSGWVARVLEYLPDNRIFRPRAQYVGARDLKYVPIDER
ncbi:MAG: citrate/2-methylcitrate synthase, partial [Armatimonadota bacterium]